MERACAASGVRNEGGEWEWEEEEEEVECRGGKGG